MNRDPAFCTPMMRTISRMNSGIRWKNPTRDDCNNYSKTATPTIANGKVYLASFGTRNTGSGQLCVYGLLPDGPAPSPPSSVACLRWRWASLAVMGGIQRRHHICCEEIDQG